MTIIPTALEIYSFGESAEDTFYLLFDKRKFEGEIDMEKLKLTDPRNFDSVLNEMGCVLMLSGDQVEELQKRGELDPEELHQSMVQLAVKEGLMK